MKRNFTKHHGDKLVLNTLHLNLAVSALTVIYGNILQLANILHCLQEGQQTMSCSDCVQHKELSQPSTSKNKELEQENQGDLNQEKVCM